jgi:hypothetical protein
MPSFRRRPESRDFLGLAFAGATISFDFFDKEKPCV